MKTVILIIQIGLLLVEMSIVLGQETKNDAPSSKPIEQFNAKISPYLKPIEHGISFFTVYDSRNNRSNVPSIVPKNLNELISHAENVCNDRNLKQVAVRLIYVVVVSPNGDKRGILLGLEFERSKGGIERKMYKFDENESDFIKSSIK